LVAYIEVVERYLLDYVEIKGNMDVLYLLRYATMNSLRDAILNKSEEIQLAVNALSPSRKKMSPKDRKANEEFVAKLKSIRERHRP